MPGRSTSSPRASASTIATTTSRARCPIRRPCRPHRSSAVPTASAPGRPASTRTGLWSRTSRSTAAIAGSAIIRRRSTPWPTAWRSPKASGPSSTARAGRAWSIPTGVVLKLGARHSSGAIFSCRSNDARLESRAPSALRLLLLHARLDLLVGLLHAVLDDPEGVAARLLNQLGDVARVGDGRFHRLLRELGLLGYHFLRTAAGLVFLGHLGDVLDRLLEDGALLAGDLAGAARHGIEVLLVMLHDLGDVDLRQLQLLAQVLEHVGEALGCLGHANLLQSLG